MPFADELSMNFIITSRQDCPVFGLNIYLLACSKDDALKKTFCVLGNFAICMFHFRLLIFFQNKLFLKGTLRNTIKVSISLDPDQARIQTVYRFYQQMTLTERGGVKEGINSAKRCQK